jgi:hypothetical protein
VLEQKLEVGCEKNEKAEPEEGRVKVH